ncbi:hypothetical protein BDR03DRAFT_950183 [Suillus americanus]|nr:hypothetical protein BDR03DRAFT_950183 [Suillus americanus]
MIWCACSATTNGNEQAHRNVNRDGANLTLLGGIMRGRAFDDRAAQSIIDSMFMCHCALAFVIVNRDSTHVYRASRSITRQALSQRRHVMQNPVVRPGADN